MQENAQAKVKAKEKGKEKEKEKAIVTIAAKQAITQETAGAKAKEKVSQHSR